MGKNVFIPKKFEKLKRVKSWIEKIQTVNWNIVITERVQYIFLNFKILFLIK
jgi:hypothetical protein